MRLSRLSISIGTLAIGIVLCFLLLLGFALVARAGLWNRFAGYLTGRTTSIDVSSPSVVEKIHQLSRLETVVYSLDKIVEGGRQSAYLPDFLVGDKLLLVAHGEVIAGVDLGQLKPGDVTVKRDAVQVRLPAPQILTTRIDNGRTRVYSRTTGLLVATDPNLESEVRLTAEQQIAQAALDDGILDKARQNARTSVAALLYGLGFHTVDVQ
jgi:Na+-transporting methylmalonyl-CoA/oxaloacetate decarboxylase gamma subunit